MFEDFENEEAQMDPVKAAKTADQIEAIKDKLARQNWESIKRHGVNLDYYSDSEKVEVLREIITETLQYFEDIEEYEKCMDLKEVLDHI